MKSIILVVICSLLAFSSVGFAADVSGKSAPAIAVASGNTSTQEQGAININTADAQTLTRLKGVGLKKAEAIVAWRNANGSFKTLEQLAEVKGIGSKTVEINRTMLRLQ
ncbi:MAG TPA: ComEA family DNA-binding protein [Cellvibrio sp.]|nr:ComEA family DNA-binding protein [Cellvibrio sp.]